MKIKNLMGFVLTATLLIAANAHSAQSEVASANFTEASSSYCETLNGAWADSNGKALLSIELRLIDTLVVFTTANTEDDRIRNYGLDGGDREIYQMSPVTHYRGVCVGQTVSITYFNKSSSNPFVNKVKYYLDSTGHLIIEESNPASTKILTRISN